ncbi:amino acid-binding protein [Dehalococcoides mccartyi]|uniref:ACT domain-containing protein n=1 Tax=Dehalococcoides mccartyi TaxID=61435 RepID=UPI0002B76FB9|nr:ACT domain-containing protein [Dehalococcoides mccartyi]AGG08045.1 amino acid-binding ACT domain-containing protein [Dehalococcoides mccartyi BTF08]AQU06027.1 amino acid-binding protein [Dehalococcoides mccartyi]AQU07472.1 amino acid-binding protein [Dehalococcoides mccartyi]AQW62573.1 amino acid-binding protein [Dehalococcoides mccartyi]KSV17482.1 amino acid-binding protein [Dehalococcoides mccartyi]
MMIKQVSVFVENKPGRLYAILKAMDKSKINIRALSVSETDEFGIVRMILDDPDAGAEALKTAGFTSRTDMMVTAEIPDIPSGLLKTVVEPLSKADINIDYFYAFLDSTPGTARIVLKVSNPEKAEIILV